MLPSDNCLPLETELRALSLGTHAGIAGSNPSAPEAS